MVSDRWAGTRRSRVPSHLSLTQSTSHPLFYNTPCFSLIMTKLNTLSQIKLIAKRRIGLKVSTAIVCLSVILYICYGDWRMETFKSMDYTTRLQKELEKEQAHISELRQVIGELQ